MNPLLKILVAGGLVATGGRVATHGGEDVESLKKIATPIFSSNKGIERIDPASVTLPKGIVRVQR